ncbi:unnamed protein product [Adineta ricciae]|uniref:ELMO domain-containing protein n=1 Tax=Adineta ricciae TaxID=249248 RepID=A0A814M3B8_ADIRI|nr:unnamed protein product [Adineta ricciae]CAF1071260.1 unnamed protein product [Adineta ricciae]
MSYVFLDTMPWSYAISTLVLQFHRVIMYLLTGKSELERIIANRTLPFSSRVHQIENSVNFTLSNPLDAEIQQAKCDQKKSLVHDKVYVVIHKLDLYQKLVKQVESIRLTKVTATDEKHLELFEKIWSRLVTQADDDHEELQMISKRWTKIGFQGSNPLTDFRGMGLLGLQCIEYLSRDRETCLTYINIRPPNDYSFAIGVINIVSWIVHLLEPDPFKNIHFHPLLTHFSIYPCNLDEFFRLFLLVMQEWHRFWTGQNANIMQFEQLSKIFRAQLLAECQQFRPIRRGFSAKISK